MKILYLTLESYLSQPIIQSQVINLFKSIINQKEVQHEFDITLITFDHIETKNKKFDHPGLQKVSHISYKNRGMLRNLLFLTLHLNKTLRYSPIIHVRSYLPMIPALVAKLLYRKKVIFDMRGVLPEETLLRKRSKIQYKMLYMLEQIACKYADKVVVVSSSFKAAVLNRSHVSPEKVIIIPTFSVNSVDPIVPKEIPDFRKDIFKSQDAVIFVYSGAYEKWQCAEQVIQFFNAARNKLKNARFMILSKNTEEFSSLMKKNFPEELYYIRNVQNNNLIYYLKQCNYGLLFRERNIINQVAAPIKFKDYLSAGIPVIITDGIGDYAKYTHDHKLGYILDNMDELGFEKVLTQILDPLNKFDNKKIELAAEKLFDVEIAARNYIALYDALNHS